MKTRKQFTTEEWRVLFTEASRASHEAALRNVRPVANDLGGPDRFEDEARNYLDMERQWAAEHRWVGAGVLAAVVFWAALLAWGLSQ